MKYTEQDIPLLIKTKEKFTEIYRTIINKSTDSCSFCQYYSDCSICPASFDSNKRCNELYEKYAIARIENFELCPSHCCTLKGYFLSVVKMILGRPISCEETKCTFRGDEYHEFRITW